MSEPVLRRAHPALRAPFNVWDLVALAIIVGIFVLSWLISFLIYRARGYDEIEIEAAGG